MYRTVFTVDILVVEDWIVILPSWIIRKSRVGLLFYRRGSSGSRGLDCYFNDDHLDFENWIGLLFYRRGSSGSRGLDRIVVITSRIIRKSRIGRGGSSGSRGLDVVDHLDFENWIGLLF